MSGPLSLMASRILAGVAVKLPPPGYPSTTTLAPDFASPWAKVNGAGGRFGTARIAMSTEGSYDTTVASSGLPLAYTWTLLDPATTCALVITRSGAITNPLPSKTFWQLGARLRTLTTLGAVAVTTGLVASAGSGDATGTTGVRLNGSSTAGRPEGFSSADNRLGPVFSHGGATSFTWASTRDPRTAAASSGWSFDCVSGVASSQAAVNTTTSCTPTPMTESAVRIERLRIAPRTARPNTTPATSPTTTSARIKNSAVNSLARGAAMWLTMCGASSTPAIAPSSTPTNDSREPSAPERQPELAARNATASTAMSSHCDGVIEFIAAHLGYRPAASGRRARGSRRCPTAWPSRRRQAPRRSLGQ